MSLPSINDSVHVIGGDSAAGSSGGCSMHYSGRG
jgi:hypothetical protein